MQKLINAAADIPGEALDGLTRTAAGIARLSGSTTAIRAAAATGPAVAGSPAVTLVSGGGAGHEPAHAGYVGDGMLTAAVVGEVFTPPSADAVLAAIRAAASPAGVLLIVGNHPGDRLAFGLAAEHARADGLAIGTMGVALSPCTVPAAGQPAILLDDGEVEWGLGINGEPGSGRSALVPARQVAARLIDTILTARGIEAGQQVAVLVNGLGATPPTELSIMAGAAAQHLADRGVEATRLWSGTFLTALDLAGVSISLLPLDDAVLAGLDAPTSAPAWPRTVTPPAPTVIDAPTAPTAVAGQLDGADPLRRALEAVAEVLVSARDELTELDRESGDGDLGVTLARGAAALLAECPEYPGPGTGSGRDGSSERGGPARVLRATAATLQRTTSGVAGPLHVILLLRASSALPEHPSAADWATAFQAGVAGVREVGGANPGDRTLVDALQPAADTFAAQLNAGMPWPVALRAAATAASTGAAATADQPARLGRATYLGTRALGFQDPGARAVAIWLTAVAGALEG
ncbi:MAG: dihydroxyacetone kinase subunit DhaK [Actinoplanes sp.]